MVEVASACDHGRERSQCKDFGGGSICDHEQERSKCKDWGGNGICDHGRQRSRCMQELIKEVAFLIIGMHGFWCR